MKGTGGYLKQGFLCVLLLNTLIAVSQIAVGNYFYFKHGHPESRQVEEYAARYALCGLFGLAFSIFGLGGTINEKGYLFIMYFAGMSSLMIIEKLFAYDVFSFLDSIHQNDELKVDFHVIGFLYTVTFVYHIFVSIIVAACCISFRVDQQCETNNRHPEGVSSLNQPSTSQPFFQSQHYSPYSITTTS